ncbi:uncharacterized protein MEPE_03474 [Melanopsichium pennsylvanicum]|uniref:Alpha/beta hydrolase fold-3 domain-containing protein n=2 Tax=Melanopsichium pennsylvanicum TaxID=63383 RepID=A0AAJ5C5I1_9BASI|nr:uncharacterized protein BN887_00135 [Melanopsichium pennsylvanicum 4]SNX84765.1 uncharacterized protein MEPE_03474 [Melanopsichium pennsylvanicum]
MSVPSELHGTESIQLLQNPTNPSPEELAAAVKIIRQGLFDEEVTAQPDWTTTCPSVTSDTPREIRLGVLDPPGLPKTARRPVVLNWHGSGFVVPRFGMENNLCRYLGRDLHNTTFVDCDYVKSPEHPFPQGLYDCVSAIKWTLAQPWCNGEIVISGHSAGAHFSLVLASKSNALALGLTEEEYKAIKACASFYPVTDISIPQKSRRTNENGVETGIPMCPLSYHDLHFFFGAYIGYDPATHQKNALDPRVSPAKADIESFEVPCYIVACEYDPLADEAVALGKRLMEGPGGKKHGLYFAKGIGHGFESRLPSDMTSEGFDKLPGGKAALEAYAKASEFLQKTVPSTTQKA